MKNIDWKSKLIDLVIVIVGISIAFKLNSWNESKKSEKEVRHYLESFYEENLSNQERLTAALEFVVNKEKSVDTLLQILLLKDFSNKRVINFAAALMANANFIPATTTFENIKASGEFELIKDIELRKKLIGTYYSFGVSLTMSELLTNYVDDYVTPYFFNNVRFSNFSSIDQDFISNPKFENVVIGYNIMLKQQLKGYQNTLENVNDLNANLAIINSK